MITITDSRVAQNYKFYLKVINLPPFFISPLRDIKLSLNSEYIYKLPPATDKEKLPFRLIAKLDNGTSLPHNIQYVEANHTFEIS